MLESGDMQVLFILDTMYCQSEYDDLKDAIFYFYPPHIPEIQACSLCGQLFGMAEFFSDTLSWPKLIRLTLGKFTLKKWGKYLFGLGSASDSSDSKLISGLDYLCKIFCFYYRSIDDFREECVRSGADFKRSISLVWTSLLKSIKENTGGTGKLVILSRPMVLPAQVYLLGEHILQTMQRAGYFLAGCILYQRKVVNTQLPPETTFFLCHYFMEGIAKQLDSLPSGTRYCKIHLQKSHLREIIEMNNIPDFIYKNDMQAFKENSLSDLDKTQPRSYDADVDSSFEDDGNHKDKRCDDMNYLDVGSSKKWSSSAVDEKEYYQSSLQPSKQSETQNCLTDKTESLRSVFIAAKDSLRRLDINDRASKRIHYNRRKSTSVRSVNTGSRQSITENYNEINSNITGQKELIIPNNGNEGDENSADSSFFEPKDLTVKVKKKPLYSKLADYDTEFISSWETSSVNFLGNRCPIVIGHDALADENKSVQSVRSKQNDKSSRKTEATQKVGNIESKKNSKTFGSMPENDVANEVNDIGYQKDTVSLTLFTLTLLDTTCFFLSENSNPEVICSIATDCFVLLESLNNKLLQFNGQLSDMKDYSIDKSISCDNLWNVLAGDKMTKSFFLAENCIENSNIKSISMQTPSGVKYAHSSVTHSVYMENETPHEMSSIPSSKDPLSKISQMNKQKYDKMGFYLLK